MVFLLPLHYLQYAWFVTAILVTVFVAKSPKQSRFISKDELKFIRNNNTNDDTDVSESNIKTVAQMLHQIKKSTPLKAILMSGPVWSYWIMNTNIFLDNTLVTYFAIKYLNQLRHIDFHSSGIIIAITNFFHYCCLIFSAVADLWMQYLHNKGSPHSRTFARKISLFVALTLQSIMLVVIACFAVLSFHAIASGCVQCNSDANANDLAVNYLPIMVSFTTPFKCVVTSTVALLIERLNSFSAWIWWMTLLSGAACYKLLTTAFFLQFG